MSQLHKSWIEDEIEAMKDEQIKKELDALRKKNITSNKKSLDNIFVAMKDPSFEVLKAAKKVRETLNERRKERETK